MIPAQFRSRRSLATLNVIAVGSTLSSVGSAVSEWSSDANQDLSFIAAVTTLVIGVLWALLLRWPKRFRSFDMRWGWVASVPLAILATMVGVGLQSTLGVAHALPRFLDGAFEGATAGVIIWLPAVALTLLGFGVPIAWSHRLATRGLAGAERGELIVAALCLTISLLVFVVTRRSSIPSSTAIASLIVAACAAALASIREWRRRWFVRGVEAGRIPGYRMVETDEGRALLRLESRGLGYRVADVEHEICLLAANGEVMQRTARAVARRPARR